MKKIILIISLLVQVATMAAGTTGTVEAYNSNETVYLKRDEYGRPTFNESFKETKTTTGVKTEVKVNNTGLSFVADFKVKDYLIFYDGSTTTKVLEAVMKDSSVWAKYDLPEMNNIMSYVKGTYKTEGKIEVEGDASYKLAEKLSAGLNSKTEFDFADENEGLTSDKITSTHKLYLKGEYNKIKDIYAELGVKHSYDKDVAAKNVFLNAKASYEATKDLILTGKIDFKRTFNNDKMKDETILLNESKYESIREERERLKLEGIYRHSYLLSAKYTGVKDAELKLDAFVEHNRLGDRTTILIFGVKPELRYTGIANLVLSSKNVLAGVINDHYRGKETAGYFKLNANAEYTYNVTDKFTIKPSLDITTEISPSNFYFVALSPKIAAEYKPVENLTISGDISPMFVFEDKRQDFGYKQTVVKSNLNIKYTW